MRPPHSLQKSYGGGDIGIEKALNHPFYGEWVSGYVADAYHEENQVLINLMDRLSDGYSEKQLQHLEEIFMACSRYEMAFWDMAWEMRR